MDALVVVVGRRSRDGWESGRGVGKEVLGFLSGHHDVGLVNK